MITYNFPFFKLQYDAPYVTTCYGDGTSCVVWTNEEDITHGANMGIDGDQHKILHELTHSLVALARGSSVCPIAWAQAHNAVMPVGAKYLEELIMAMGYLSMEAAMPEANWWCRLSEVQKFCNPNELAKDIFLLFAGVESKKYCITVEQNEYRHKNTY